MPGCRRHAADKESGGFSDWWGHYFSMTAAAVFLATDKANKTQCESADIKWLLMELPARALGCCETLRRDSKSSAGNSSHIPSSTVEWFHSGSHTAKISSAGEPCTRTCVHCRHLFEKWFTLSTFELILEKGSWCLRWSIYGKINTIMATIQKKMQLNLADITNKSAEGN